MESGDWFSKVVFPCISRVVPKNRDVLDKYGTNKGCAKMPPKRRHVRTSNRYLPF